MATKEEADRALAHFDAELLTNPSVNYAAVVLDQDGEYVIEVGVTQERKMRELQNAPDTMNLGMAVVVPASLPIPNEQRVIDPAAPRIPVRLQQSDPMTFFQYTGTYRPAKGGASIGNANFNDSGTWGAVVRLGPDNTNRYALTCWHVLDKNSAPIGSSVYQPGAGDGGIGPLARVGTLKWAHLSERVDLAFAKLDMPWTQYGALGTFGYGAITGKTTVNIGHAVKKCGRTTRETTGTVVSDNATVQVVTPIGTRTFRNQLKLSAMAAEGDSGAILLSMDNKAVGVIFGGNASMAVANKIDDVESAIRSSAPADIGGNMTGAVLFFS